MTAPPPHLRSAGRDAERKFEREIIRVRDLYKHWFARGLARLEGFLVPKHLEWLANRDPLHSIRSKSLGRYLAVATLQPHHGYSDVPGVHLAFYIQVSIPARHSANGYFRFDTLGELPRLYKLEIGENATRDYAERGERALEDTRPGVRRLKPQR